MDLSRLNLLMRKNYIHIVAIALLVVASPSFADGPPSGGASAGVVQTVTAVKGPASGGEAGLSSYQDEADASGDDVRREPDAEATMPEDGPPDGLYGIRVKSLRLTAAGYMLTLRYEVTDPEEAAMLLTRNSNAYLVHDQSGRVLAVPSMAKVGKLQQTNNPPEVGRVYFMMFDSGGIGLVKPGDTLTLIVNDRFFEGLKVQ